MVNQTIRARVKAANEFIKTNLGYIGAGVGGIALGSALGVVAARSSRKKSRTRRRKVKRSNTRKRNYTYKRSKRTKGRRYTPHTAGKRRDTSRRRIRYTSKGQPYVIVAGGKARFIKKSSAHNSRKRSGGKY